MANGCGKCVSYVTELNITDELHNPMGNVHHQLPGQRGSATLHRMQMQDQPTVMVTSHRKDAYRQAWLGGEMDSATIHRLMICG